MAQKDICSNLLILGAGQYGMVAEEIAEATGAYDKVEFLDDKSPLAIGMLRDFESFVGQYTAAIVAIGNSELRLAYIEKLEEAGYTIPCLIHPRAYVSPSAVVGKGSFIEPMSVVHTGVEIGVGCIVSAGTIINHNSIIGSGCHLNCGTIVLARAVVSSGTRTDCGSVVGD